MTEEQLNQDPPITLKSLPVQWIEIRDGVILKRGCTQVKISGDGAAAGVRLILDATGSRGATAEDLLALFDPDQRPAVEQLVHWLVSKGLLVSTNGSDPIGDAHESSVDIFYWQFGESASGVANRLNSRSLCILGVNGISQQLAASLVASGFENFQVVDVPRLRNRRLFDDRGYLRVDQWLSPSRHPVPEEEWSETTDIKALDCLVATSDFGGVQDLREWNHVCVSNRQAFLPVVLQDLIGYVGPLVIPGETACYECLLARLYSNLKQFQIQQAMDTVASEGQRVTGYLPPMASILGDLAAFELIRFYSGALPLKTMGKLIEVSLLEPRLLSRKVLKLPRCPVCSPMISRPASASALNVSPPVSQKET